MDCVAAVKVRYCFILISQTPEQGLRPAFEIAENSLRRTNIYCCISTGSQIWNECWCKVGHPLHAQLPADDRVKQTISTRLWLHLELKAIWETEVEDLNLLHASVPVSPLKSRNKLSCSNTAFSNTSPYFIFNSKCTPGIIFLFLTLTMSLSFPPKPSLSH